MSRGYNDVLASAKDVEYFRTRDNTGEYAVMNKETILFRWGIIWNPSYSSDTNHIRHLLRIPDLAIILTTETP